MSPNPQQTPPEPASHTINTRNFGPLTVREDQVIIFAPGLLGFTSLHRYVLIERRQESPFLWLQSLDNPELAFVVIDPAVILSDYRPTLKGAMQELTAENEDDLKVLVILTIPPGRPQDMTANLMGPLAVNLKNRRGKQLVLEDPRYSHKHRVLPK